MLQQQRRVCTTVRRAHWLHTVEAVHLAAPSSRRTVAEQRGSEAARAIAVNAFAPPPGANSKRPSQGGRTRSGRHHAGMRGSDPGGAVCGRELALNAHEQPHWGRVAHATDVMEHLQRDRKVAFKPGRTTRSSICVVHLSTRPHRVQSSGGLTGNARAAAECESDTSTIDRRNRFLSRVRALV